MSIIQTECFDTHKEAWYFMKYCDRKGWPCGFPSQPLTCTEGKTFFTLTFDGPLDGLEQWEADEIAHLYDVEGDCAHNTYAWQVDK